MSSVQDLSYRFMTIVHYYGPSSTIQRILTVNQGIGFPNGGEKLWDSPLIIPNNSPIRVVIQSTPFYKPCALVVESKHLAVLDFMSR